MIEDDFDEEDIIESTFSKFQNNYLAHCSLIKQSSTWNREKRVLKTFGKFIGDIDLNTIDRQLIDNYIKYRLEQKTNKPNGIVSKSTVNLELRHLKAIFNIAVS